MTEIDQNPLTAAAAVGTVDPSATPAEAVAQVAPVVAQAVAANAGPVITESIRTSVLSIENEINALIKERSEVVRGALVALIAQLHLLMLGPGGTGKSLLVRTLANHIADARYFEVAVDETTDPSQVFGPPDIKAMVEDGKTRRVGDGMLPEANIAFIDEFFNANGPLLHSMMPALNERVWHNNGQPSAIPLISGFMGTNKLNADADQAALWDRIHMRYIVDYVGARQAQIDMVGDAIARMALLGRGVGTHLAGQQITQVTLDELATAHTEALSLDVPDAVVEEFFNIRDELQHGKAQVKISDRRAVEGMAAVMANGWLRGHTSVTVGDLDILTSMWWTTQDQLPVARGVILEATNPGEKAALDLLAELDKLRKEVDEVTNSEVDPTRKKRTGIEAVRNAKNLIAEAEGHRLKAEAAGASTAKLDELLGKADQFKKDVADKVFGIDPSQMTPADPSA